MDGCPLGLGLVVEDKPTEFPYNTFNILSLSLSPLSHLGPIGLYPLVLVILPLPTLVTVCATVQEV